MANNKLKLLDRINAEILNFVSKKRGKAVLIALTLFSFLSFALLIKIKLGTGVGDIGLLQSAVFFSMPVVYVFILKIIQNPNDNVQSEQSK